MSDNSSIEWTEASWNFVSGCTKVSAGCDHCYIERTPPFRMAGRKFDKPGTGGTTGVVLHPERLEMPLRWRKPRRIFVNSLADLFHDDVPEEFIARAFAVMAQTPQHTYQVLTKRPARMRALLRKWSPVTGVVPWVHTGPWPLPNVWLGVSAENQQWADIRIPALLDTPAAVRFLSCEPLLGPINLRLLDYTDEHTCGFDQPGWPHEPHCGMEPGTHFGISWVIVGGESGPGARPMHPDWARGLRDQCTAAGVPFFFKQWGEWTQRVSVLDTMHRPMQYIDEDQIGPNSDERMWRLGKKLAGRELDGRTWDEYPRGGE